ncbi:MAG: hypothetical protein M1840_005664 [Geoglossum simile]|nr:MAG: hypothetical protein M1840_005664 [Geoglossum simile]
MHFPTSPRALSAAAILVHLASAVPHGHKKDWGNCSSVIPRAVAERQQETLEWAVIGDSWASGVAYAASNRWDSNLDGCFRTTEAWGAQMSTDLEWAPKQNFHFAACAGAKFDNLKTGQMPNTGSPQLVITTIGGNNAFFGTTVDNCIYQAIPTNFYGNPYDQDSDGTGECWKSLVAISTYIANQESGLSFDLKRTLDDLFATDQAKSHTDFYLYISSYAHFFNADSDPCDNWTFSPWWRYWKPKLVKSLRKEFNDRTDGFHNVYKTVIDSYVPPTGNHLGFIDVTHGFEGHHFCEPEHSLEGQWSSGDVWIWNLGLSNNDGSIVVGKIATDVNGTQYMDQAEGDNETFYKEVNPFGSSGPISSGWAGRPFHPKVLGHGAMKKIMIAALRNDHVPGVYIPALKKA